MWTGARATRADALGGLVLAAVLVPGAAHAEGTPHPCVGRWVGEGQNDGSLPWAIDLTVTSVEARCGGIEYDSSQLDCGGPFSDCRFEGSTLRVTERFSHNDNCAEGRLELVCEGDTMQYAWHGWEIVRTTLRRVPPPDTRPPTSPTSTSPPESSPPERYEPEPEPEPGDETPTAAPSGGCGCAVGGRSSAPWLLAILAALVIRGRFA